MAFERGGLRNGVPSTGVKGYVHEKTILHCRDKGVRRAEGGVILSESKITPVAINCYDRTITM